MLKRPQEEEGLEPAAKKQHVENEAAQPQAECLVESTNVIAKEEAQPSTTADAPSYAVHTIDVYSSAKSEDPLCSVRLLGTHTLLHLTDAITRHLLGLAASEHEWNVLPAVRGPCYLDDDAHQTKLLAALELEPGAHLGLTYNYDLAATNFFFLRVVSVVETPAEKLAGGPRLPHVGPAQSDPAVLARYVLARPEGCPSMDEVFPHFAKAVLDPGSLGTVFGHASKSFCVAVKQRPGEDGDAVYAPHRFRSWDHCLVAVEKALAERARLPEDAEWLTTRVYPAHLMHHDDERSYSTTYCGLRGVVRESTEQSDAEVAAVRARGFSTRFILPRTIKAFDGGPRTLRWFSYRDGKLTVCKSSIVEPETLRTYKPQNVLKAIAGPFTSLDQLFAAVESSW